MLTCIYIYIYTHIHIYICINVDVLIVVCCPKEDYRSVLAMRLPLCLIALYGNPSLNLFI